MPSGGEDAPPQLIYLFESGWAPDGQIEGDLSPYSGNGNIENDLEIRFNSSSGTGGEVIGQGNIEVIVHLDENGENPFKDMYIMSLFFTINAGLNSEIGTVNTVDNTEYSLNMLYSFTDASGFTITESPIGTGVYQFMNLTSIIGVGGDGPQVSTITKTNSGDPVVIVENVTVNSLPGHLVHLDQTSFTDINHNIDGNNNDDYYVHVYVDGSGHIEHNNYDLQSDLDNLIKCIQTEQLGGTGVANGAIVPIPPLVGSVSEAYALLRRKYNFDYSWEKYQNTYFATDILSIINYTNEYITIELPEVIVTVDPDAPEPEPESEPDYSLRISTVDISGERYYKLEAKYDSSGDFKKLTGFLATFDIDENIVVDLSSGGINDLQNAFIYGNIDLTIDGETTSFQKAYVGPKSIALAVPLSSGLVGNGKYMLLGYIELPSNGQELKLQHGWSDTGPYCSIDVDSEMVDESSIAKFLQYPKRSEKNVLTINMDPETGIVSLHTLNQAVLNNYRLKAVQLEFESLPSNGIEYLWNPIGGLGDDGSKKALWHDHIRQGSFNLTYIACTIDVGVLQDSADVNYLPDGVPINNVNYNIATIGDAASEQSGLYEEGDLPKLLESLVSSTQVLLWDVVNQIDITCRNAPYQGEYKLSISNKKIANFSDSESE